MQGWMGGAPRDTWGMERDSFVWMLHGDVGEDNSTPMVLSEADATGDWIESGPHLMLFPKDVATHRLARADGLGVHLVQPLLFQHVGTYSVILHHEKNPANVVSAGFSLD